MLVDSDFQAMWPERTRKCFVFLRLLVGYLVVDKPPSSHGFPEGGDSLYVIKMPQVKVKKIC